MTEPEMSSSEQPACDEVVDALDTRVLAARNGDPEGLRWLRETLPNDPDRANPHCFYVKDGELVEDGDWLSRVPRKDLYPDIPKFVTEYYSRHRGVSASYVISEVQTYPSLIDKFAVRGYKDIIQIEDKLITNDLLKHAERVRLTERLAQLSSDQAPVWQNWVRMVAADGSIFDNIIFYWLREPAEPKEWDYLDPVKRRRRFGIEFARQFFEKLSQDHMDFLGLRLADGCVEGSGEVIQCVFLNDPIKTANQRAKALGLKFTFEKFD